MTSLSRGISFSLAILMSFSGFLYAQSTPVGPVTSSKDSFRLQFDNQGGFKVFRMDSQDGTAHALLNPNVDFPVTINVFREATLIPLVQQAPEPNLSDDPGYRGPTFLAGDVKIQIWGLDMGPAGSGWSACRYEFQNGGKTLETISVHLVLDTWLGENAREHFSLNQIPNGNRSGIIDETQVLPQDWTQVIGSQRSGSADGFYLLFPSKKLSIISPQRLLAANVRRLQNNQANFDFEIHRAFNLLPFSINDSAIDLFYDSLVLAPNQKISIDVVFNGNLDLDPAHIIAAIDRLHAIKPSASVYIPNQGTEQINNPVTTKRAEQVKKLNGLIDRVNTMLKDPHYRQGDLEKLIESIAETKNTLQPEP